jgi:hypothetical protein
MLSGISLSLSWYIRPSNPKTAPTIKSVIGICHKENAICTYIVVTCMHGTVQDAAVLVSTTSESRVRVRVRVRVRG